MRLAPSSDTLRVLTSSIYCGSVFYVSHSYVNVSAWLCVIIACLIVSTAPLYAVLAALLERGQGTPAPKDIQETANVLSVLMGCPKVPIVVAASEPGSAALRGLTKKNTRISIDTFLLSIPPQHLQGVISHELAHLRLGHRKQVALVHSFAWFFPQVFLSALLWDTILGVEGMIMLSFACSFSTSACFLLYYHLMRAQEYEADRWAQELLGARYSDALSDHLRNAADHSTRVKLLASHPPASYRISRLEES